VRRVDWIRQFFDRRKTAIIELNKDRSEYLKTRPKERRLIPLTLQIIKLQLSTLMTDFRTFSVAIKDLAVIIKGKSPKPLPISDVAILNARMVYIWLNLLYAYSIGLPFIAVEYVSRKLAPPEAVTTLLILTGTFILLLGLVLEFVATFLLN
jgi:hypothetical protein